MKKNERRRERKKKKEREREIWRKKDWDKESAR